jgi:hypothetical protein
MLCCFGPPAVFEGCIGTTCVRFGLTLHHVEAGHGRIRNFVAVAVVAYLDQSLGNCAVEGCEWVSPA